MRQRELGQRTLALDFDARLNHRACVSSYGFRHSSQALSTTTMTSVDGIPACLFAAAPVLRQPHPESDPALATEVLPGPPPLASVQQAVLQKRDNKKVPFAVSYLPASDPGTTYGANTVSTMASASESDGPLRKRARLAKGCVSSSLSPLPTLTLSPSPSRPSRRAAYTERLSVLSGTAAVACGRTLLSRQPP